MEFVGGAYSLIYEFISSILTVSKGRKTFNDVKMEGNELCMILKDALCEGFSSYIGKEDLMISLKSNYDITSYDV